MNLLILTYNDKDFKIFELFTIKQANNLIQRKHLNVTLLVVDNTDNKISHDQLDPRIEFHYITFKTKKNALSTLEWFFESENKTHLINALEKILTEKTFDIIQLDSIIFSLFLNNIHSLSNKSKIVYRQYIDEIEAIQTLSQNYKLPIFKTLSINRLSNKLHSLLRFYKNKFDAIILADPKLINKYEYPTKYFIIPNKLPKKTELPVGPTKFTFNIFYLGPMYLIETQHGILWFLNEIWPKILKELPYLQLHLAGQSEKWFINIISSKQNVHYYPEIQNFDKFLDNKTLFILPYDKTIGILPEYLEAIYRGKIIIAHTDAIHGWELTAMINFIPIHNAQQYIESILHIYQKNEIQQYFSKQILNFANEKLSDEYLSEVLANFYTKLIKTPNDYEHDNEI